MINLKRNKKIGSYIHDQTPFARRKWKRSNNRQMRQNSKKITRESL